MKKLALALVLLLVPSLAWAQCTGVFPPNTVCGNLSGSPAPPSAFTASSVVGPGSTTVGDIAVWNNTVGSLLKDVPPLQIYGTIGNNLFLSGPSTGGPLNPTFRAITGTDIAAALATISNPTTQTFLSGSGTYTTPANVKWIEIELQGAGGGGSGSGSTPGTGGVGGNTCWNTSGAACTSPVYQAGGGGAGGAGNIGGAGGTVSGSATCYKAITGGTGYGAPSATSNSTGGAGGNSVNGGGAPATVGQAGAAGTTNTGGGGAGGGTAASNSAGNGGGAGANCRAIISAPAATYTYAVGVAGTAGTAGSQFAGGAGGSGLVVVVEHYAP